MNPYHTNFKQYIPLATKDISISLGDEFKHSPQYLHMLYRDIASLGILVLKLHVNAIQSPVYYYQIYKKKFLVTMGIEPGTYVLNHNISVALP